MTSFKRFGTSVSEIARFTSYQKTVFFSKAESLSSKSKLTSDQREYPRIVFKSLYKSSPVILRLLPRSTLHNVYLVGDKKNKVLIRINKNPKIYKEFHFLIEIEINKLLKKYALQYVNIFHTDLTRNVIPVDYQVSEFLLGETIYNLSKKKKIGKEIFVDLGKLTARIHKIHTKNFGPFSLNNLLEGKGLIGIYDSWQKYLLCNLEKHVQYCMDYKVFNQDFALKIIKTFIKASKSLPKISPVLLHGDLANHNVFVNKNKISALIDWEDAVSGDPVFDIAFYGSGVFGHDNWLKGFIDGYQSISRLPTEFWLRYWVYFLRISIAKAVARQKNNTQSKIINKRIESAFSALLTLVR